MRIEDLVGMRIKEARERAGMTQPQLGEWLAPLLGKPLPRQAIHAAEQGKRQFTAAELAAFAHVLGGSVADLFALPVGVDHLEMPSGQRLTREDLRQGAAAGPASIEKMRETLADLVRSAEAVQVTGFRVEQTAKALHDALDRAFDDAGGDPAR